MFLRRLKSFFTALFTIGRAEDSFVSLCLSWRSDVWLRRYYHFSRRPSQKLVCTNSVGIEGLNFQYLSFSCSIHSTISYVVFFSVFFLSSVFPLLNSLMGEPCSDHVRVPVVFDLYPLRIRYSPFIFLNFSCTLSRFFVLTLILSISYHVLLVKTNLC